MRYDPKRKRTFPNQEEWRLYIALDRVGVRFDKIPKVKPDAPGHENWYSIARVWYDEERWGVVEWEGISYIKSHSANSRTQRTTQRRLDYLKEQGIPVLFLNRRVSSVEMEMEIRRWIDKERKVRK